MAWVHQPNLTTSPPFPGAGLLQNLHAGLTNSSPAGTLQCSAFNEMSGHNMTQHFRLLGMRTRPLQELRLHSCSSKQRHT